LASTTGFCGGVLKGFLLSDKDFVAFPEMIFSDRLSKSGFEKFRQTICPRG
jgi:hypothetical protein